ncbi:MAG: oligosaccharide flippase family protein [Oscillospiraceae bacterium]|nr:oligosaccharide flippase family protein [Oscillospiraceae bacterium]
MKNAKKILLNTLLLTAVSFLMQTVNVSFNVWLTNRIGAAGIGLFQLIMTVYGLSVTLGCGGIRLASTRLTVEADAKGENPGHIMRRCILYGLCAGCLISVIVLLGTDVIAAKWLSDSRSAVPLRVLALSLPFIAMSTAMNGYFTALRKMVKYSSVRMAEQGVKIVCVALMLARLLPKGVEYGVIAIVSGILISEAFSFLCLFFLYVTGERSFAGRPKTRFTLKSITRIALPDVSGAGARSVLLMIEHLLIPVGFKKSGSSQEQALSIYGNIHGMVFPMLLYPSAILTSLSGMLVPEIAECKARGMENRITYIIMRVMKITLIFSIGAAGIMYAFAGGLSQLVYKNSDSAFYIQLLAPLIPVMYCDMTVDGMLKGLDQQLYSMKYNIIDSAMCVALVYILLPKYSVKGYIIVLFVSEIVNFFLSVRRLTIVSTVQIDLPRDVFVPLACIFCSAAGVSVLADVTGVSAAYSVFSITVCILLSLASYFAMMYWFSCVTKEDINWFKSVFRRQEAGIRRHKSERNAV